MTTIRTEDPVNTSADKGHAKTTANQDQKRNSISRRAAFGIGGSLVGSAAVSSAVAALGRPDPTGPSGGASGPTPHQRAYYSKARF